VSGGDGDDCGGIIRMMVIIAADIFLVLSLLFFHRDFERLDKQKTIEQKEKLAEALSIKVIVNWKSNSYIDTRGNAFVLVTAHYFLT
jgi:hypothetical protein